MKRAVLLSSLQTSSDGPFVVGAGPEDKERSAVCNMYEAVGRAAVNTDRQGEKNLDRQRS